jgi:2-aminoethylphosphonate-pyruvate transaminase
MKAHISIRHSAKLSLEPGQLKLFCPGPVLTSPRVRQAMARADIAHRDAVFVELLDRVRARLKAVAGAPEHEALVLGGGGTAATEAAFATFIAPEERLLVISNGAFGERMAEIGVALGVPVSHLRYDWGDPVVLDQVAGMLDGDHRIKAVAMVHHETSIGRLNPVVEVGRLLAPRRIRFLVDVVSSLGAEEFDTVRARASVVIGSANKCLHGVAGVGFVLVRHDLWDETEHVRPRSMYLDLRRYRGAARENGQTPFTPPVAAISALDEALLELEEQGGVAARRARYQELNQQIRSGLTRLGLRVRFDGPGTACSLTVAQLPPGKPYDVFYAELRDRGFLVYRGKGPISHDTFLVANMGHLDSAIVSDFLDAVAEACGRPARATSQRVRQLPA